MIDRWNGTDKPTLFIGSSNEGRQVAEAIHDRLQYDAEITPWTAAIKLSTATLESLIDELDRFDFSILVLTGDDLTESRGALLKSPRDNVVFELGLFMGRLNRTRTFIVQDSSSPLKIPSDLLDVTVALYDGARRDKNLRAAVDPACALIREQIERLGVRPKVQRFVEYYQQVLQSSNLALRFWAKETCGKCFSAIERLATVEEFEYEEDDHYIVMEQLYGYAGPSDWIHAVSWNELSDWQHALMGGRYSDFNALAAANGATVERIFIYRDRSELKQLGSFLDRQKSEGLKVRVADAAALDASQSHLENRLIVQITNRGRYTVWPEHDGDGNFVKATVSCDLAKYEQFERIFQVIKSVSYPWTKSVKSRLLKSVNKLTIRN